MKSPRAFALLGTAALLSIGSVARADVITDWNQIGTTAAANAGGNNGTGANGYTRTLAAANLAVYDAVNSISGTHNPYVAVVPFSGPASTDAAVVEASYQVLSTLLPASQQAYLATQHTNALNAISNGAAKTTGIAIGQAAASNIIAARTGDGSPGNSPTPFTGNTATGQWRPTPGVYGANGGGTFAAVDNAAAANATWGSVKPFALPANWKSNPLYQAPAPPVVGSPAYNASLANTQSKGAANSVTRTADQTQIAEFWYPGSTITWNDIARTIIASKGLSQDEEARDRNLWQFQRSVRVLTMGSSDVLACLSQPVRLNKPIFFRGLSIKASAAITCVNRESYACLARLITPRTAAGSGDFQDLFELTSLKTFCYLACGPLCDRSCANLAEVIIQIG